MFIHLKIRSSKLNTIWGKEKIATIILLALTSELCQRTFHASTVFDKENTD